jgi:NADPH-dependent curcumin reductase CurA
MQHLLTWCEQGKLKPGAPSIFALEEAPKAMVQLLERSLTGKAVIQLREGDSVQ